MTRLHQCSQLRNILLTINNADCKKHYFCEPGLETNGPECPVSFYTADRKIYNHSLLRSDMSSSTSNKYDPYQHLRKFSSCFDPFLFTGILFHLLCIIIQLYHGILSHDTILLLFYFLESTAVCKSDALIGLCRVQKKSRLHGCEPEEDFLN